MSKPLLEITYKNNQGTNGFFDILEMPERNILETGNFCNVKVKGNNVLFYEDSGMKKGRLIYIFSLNDYEVLFG